MAQPQFWIRTVLQTTSDERSADFRLRLDDRLLRLYRSRRDLQVDASDIFVHVQNVSRVGRDVHVVYAISRHIRNAPRANSGGWIDPAVAARFSNAKDNVNRQICRHPDTGLADLCYNIVTPAERKILFHIN